MIVSIIVAVDNNYGIGLDGDLLWHLPKDMAFFKKKTLNSCVITGRKNYYSIPKKFRPLKQRVNIVLSRSEKKIHEGIVQCKSINESLKVAKDFKKKEIFVIGGGEIYRQFLDRNLVDYIYITHVDVTLKADTYFPEFNLSEWDNIFEEKHEKDDKNKFDFTIKKYKKKKL